MRYKWSECRVNGDVFIKEYSAMQNFKYESEESLSEDGVVTTLLKEAEM